MIKRLVNDYLLVINEFWIQILGLWTFRLLLTTSIFLEFQTVDQPGSNAIEDRDPFDEDDVNFTEAVVEKSGGWADNSGNYISF